MHVPATAADAGAATPDARAADTPEKATDQPPRRSFRDRIPPARELAPWIVLIAVALIIRLIDLGARAYHHDESQIAFFSWTNIIRDGNKYEYLPLLHGPWSYYFSAFWFKIGGVTDFTARLGAAVMGTAMVAMPFFLRHQIGRIASFAAAFMLAISPAYLYYSRFDREDIHIAAFTLGILVVALRMLDRPRKWHPAALLALLALCFTVKESTLIFGFICFTFILGMVFAQIRHPAKWAVFAVLAVVAAVLLVGDVAGKPAINKATGLPEKELTARGILPMILVSGLLLCELILGWGRGKLPTLWGAVKAVGWWPWLVGVAAFLVVLVTFYSSFFTHWGGVFQPGYPGDAAQTGEHDFFDGFTYWLGQDEVRRGGEHWYFYFTVIPAHEWPELLLGMVGIGATVAAVLKLRRGDEDLWGMSPRVLPMVAFLVWLVIASWAIYSWAGEKFSWLVLHPLLPLILLAGIGVQLIWKRRRKVAGIAGLVLCTLGLAYMVYATYSVNADGPVNPREMLVTTQSGPETPEIAERIVALDKRKKAASKGATGATVLVDPNDGASFPWAWYLRDVSASYDATVRTNPDYVPTQDVLILTDATRQQMLPKLGNYEGHKFKLRVWWVRDFTKDSVGKWAKWLIGRERFNEAGGMDEWVYFKKQA